MFGNSLRFTLVKIQNMHRPYAIFLAATAFVVAMCPQPMQAQLPYTQAQYGFFTEKNIEYATVTGFSGGTEHLLLDLYKPIGDENCQRPLLVMVHGGGFLGGTKDDYDVVLICEEMARRGYATASLNYRLGMHPTNFYEPYAFCNSWINPIGSQCIYMADSLEFSRAAYRAAQDVKGAIRFLKGRHQSDSTDLQNLFVGGSSAGAITSLHAALMDLPGERLPFTDGISDAPLPDADLAGCVPAPADRSRPDLGGIDGETNLNSQDAKVQGIAAFMGAVFDLSIFAGADTPAIYLYHRTDDLVVPCYHAPLFPLYPYCIYPINLCQPLNTRPWVHGSGAIAEQLLGTGSASPPFFNDILYGYGPADGDDCLDNPPGHSIDNIPLRCENLSAFFAPLIAANGNDPATNCSADPATETVGLPVRLEVFPNPSHEGILQLRGDLPGNPSNGRLVLMDLLGREIASTRASLPSYTWDLRGRGLRDGLYFVQVRANGQSATAKWRLKN